MLDIKYIRDNADSLKKAITAKQLNPKIVDEVILEKGRNFGAIMGETMKRLGGKVGGDEVARIVKEKLT